MKTPFLAFLLAVPLVAVPQQQASAWCKFNFGVGANIGYQSGGSKSLLWGAWQASDYNAVSPQWVNGQGFNPGQPGAYPGQVGTGFQFGAGPGAPYSGDYGYGAAGYNQFNPPATGPFGAAAPEPGPAQASNPEPSPAQPAQYPAAYPQGGTVPVGYGYPPAGYGFYPARGFWYGN